MGALVAPLTVPTVMVTFIPSPQWPGTLQMKVAEPLVEASGEALGYVVGSNVYVPDVLSKVPVGEHDGAALTVCGEGNRNTTVSPTN